MSRETPRGHYEWCEVEGLNCETFGEFLLAKGIHSSVVTEVVDNRIDDELFVGLEEEDLKDRDSTCYFEID